MIKHKHSNRNEDQWTVHCDTCGKPTAQQNFETAGDAADHARKANFTTRIRNLTAPATWHCPACSVPKSVGSA